MSQPTTPQPENSLFPASWIVGPAAAGLAREGEGVEVDKGSRGARSTLVEAAMARTATRETAAPARPAVEPAPGAQALPAVEPGPEPGSAADPDPAVPPGADAAQPPATPATVLPLTASHVVDAPAARPSPGAAAGGLPSAEALAELHAEMRRLEASFAESASRQRRVVNHPDEQAIAMPLHAGEGRLTAGGRTRLGWRLPASLLLALALGGLWLLAPHTLSAPVGWLQAQWAGAVSATSAD